MQLHISLGQASLEAQKRAESRQFATELADASRDGAEAVARSAQLVVQRQHLEAQLSAAVRRRVGCFWLGWHGDCGRYNYGWS